MTGVQPVDEEAWERRGKVLTMRNAGGTYRRIARELGISAATVRRDLQRAYRDILQDTPEDMTARQRSILLDITRANYPAAMSGDKDAASTIIKALEQEAKLFGLYAPTRVLAGVSDVEFAEQAAALIASISETDPTAFKELDHAASRPPAGNPFIDAEVVDGGDGPAGPDAPQGAAVPERHPESGGDTDDWSNL